MCVSEGKRTVVYSITAKKDSHRVQDFMSSSIFLKERQSDIKCTVRLSKRNENIT